MTEPFPPEPSQPAGEGMAAEPEVTGQLLEPQIQPADQQEQEPGLSEPAHELPETMTQPVVFDDDPGTEPSPLATQLRMGGGTGNESPQLPASLPSGAGRAHALLDHALDALAEDPGQAAAIIRRAQDELDRYLPAEVKAAAIPEAAQVMAAGL